jgi:hypothetical protein
MREIETQKSQPRGRVCLLWSLPSLWPWRWKRGKTKSHKLREPKSAQILLGRIIRKAEKLALQERGGKIQGTLGQEKRGLG